MFSKSFFFFLVFLLLISRGLATSEEDHLSPLPLSFSLEHLRDLVNHLHAGMLSMAAEIETLKIASTTCEEKLKEQINETKSVKDTIHRNGQVFKNLSSRYNSRITALDDRIAAIEQKFEDLVLKVTVRAKQDDENFQPQIYVEANADFSQQQIASEQEVISEVWLENGNDDNPLSPEPLIADSATMISERDCRSNTGVYWQGYRYILIKQKLNWDDANENCHHQGGELAYTNMESVELRRAIVDEFGYRDGHSIWFGLYRIHGYHQWQYIDGSTPTSDEIRWYPGRPLDDEDYDCCHFISYQDTSYDLKTFNINCFSSAYSLCQFEC